MSMSSGSGDASSVYSVESSEKQKRLSSKLYHSLLGYESIFLFMQKILIWEKPVRSIVFFCFMHAAFLYLFLRSQYTIGFISSMILILVWLDVWKHKIWPEVRAVAPDKDEEWDELHPKLLSFPEMCEVIAAKVINLELILAKVLKSRRDYPGMFCIVFCGLGIVLSFVGYKMPGILLSYMLFMLLLLWPLAWYHNLLEKVVVQTEPLVVQLQYMLKHRSQTKLYVPKLSKDTGNVDDISEFVPNLNEKTEEILAKAICEDSEPSETGDDTMSEEFPLISRSSTPDNLAANEVYLTALPSEFPTIVDSSDTEDESSALNIYKTLHSKSNSQSQHTVVSPLPVSPEIVSAALGNILKDTLSSIAVAVHSTAKGDGGNVNHENSSSSSSDFELVDMGAEETS